MKFSALIAMLYVAQDCFKKGLGVEPVAILSESLWVWTAFGIAWVISTVVFYYE